MSTSRIASQDALHTAELLKLMLVEVDMRTLLLSQRVSKYWHSLITSSTKLKKKLFLVPATSKELCTLSIAPPAWPQTSSVQRSSMVQKIARPSSETTTAHFAALNPLMFWHGSRQPRSRTWTCGPKSLGRTSQQQAVDPSWRQMLVVQPRIFEIYAGSSRGHRLHPAGVMLGEAFDLADQLHAISEDAQRTIPYIRPCAIRATSELFWLAVEREEEIKVEGSGGSSSDVKP